MSGTSNLKLKLLYIKDILEKYTDENHILNSAEISEKLMSLYGISCERKSLYRDIDILSEYGMDIIKTRSPKNGYFLASRDFELAEIRLLSDAVQAANFITINKTKNMLTKIENLTSKYLAKQLKQQIYIDNRAKCDNEEIFYNIDSLDTAIKNYKKVRLFYSKRQINTKYATAREEKEFVLSPYAMIWSNDHYYLVANNAKYDNLMNMRIDRIRRVEVLKEQARRFSEVSEYRNYFDVADYSRKVFNMFSGRVDVIDLHCNNEILDSVLDRFGDKVNIRYISDDVFSVKTEACINDGLASWVMQFGGNIEVFAPKELRNIVKDKAKAILEKY